MKRFLLSLCAVLILAVAPASALDSYGYEGEISKDGCLNCGNWEDAMRKVALSDLQDWKIAPSDGMRAEGYKKAQAKTREVCKAQEAQMAAYRSALANEDYLSAANLTLYQWVEVSMYASEAKQLLNTIEDTEEADDDTLALAKGFFEKAQKIKDSLGEICATASNSEEKIQERLAVYQGRIDRGLLFIARIRGEKPWPKED